MLGPGVILRVAFCDSARQAVVASHSQRKCPVSIRPKGNCWDNAVAESFFASLKNEEVDASSENKDQARRPSRPTSKGFYDPTWLHS